MMGIRRRLVELDDHVDRGAVMPAFECFEVLGQLMLLAAGKGRMRHWNESDEASLKGLIEKHLRYTGSTVALRILDHWDTYRGKFVKVFPNEYKRALTELHARQTAAAARERAAA